LPDRPKMITRHMRIAEWKYKATHTHPEYWFYTAVMVAWKRLSVNVIDPLFVLFPLKHSKLLFKKYES
jgi:hypothetical protein